MHKSMASLSRPIIFTLTGGFLLVLPAMQCIFFGSPRTFAPFPMHFTLLFFVIGYFAAIVPTVVFWGACHRLFKGNPKTPNYIMAISFILGALSIFWFIASWDHGLQYQGLIHTKTILILNVFLYLSSHVLLIWGKGRPSYSVTFCGQWLLFFWFTWVAFPWLGELM